MTKRSPFRYFRTSPKITRLAVMLYARFPASLRKLEDLLHRRRIEVRHTTQETKVEMGRMPLSSDGVTLCQACGVKRALSR